MEAKVHHYEDILAGNALYNTNTAIVKLHILYLFFNFLLYLLKTSLGIIPKK